MDSLERQAQNARRLGSFFLSLLLLYVRPAASLFGDEMATKRKQKRTVNRRSKAEMLSDIQASFAAKVPVTYDERVLIAENAYKYIDDMMANPGIHGFMNLVDIVNLLVMVIHSTDTRKKCLVRHKCPNALEWLYERTDPGIKVAQTINDCLWGLQKVMERHERTGSWALDGTVIALLETVFTWYQQVTSVMPRAVLMDCLQKMDKHHVVDSPEGKRVHIVFVELDKEYIRRESEWDSIELS